VDLVITLMDVWVLDAGQIRELRETHGVPVAHWMPVDCDPLSAMDERYLRESGGIPIAMSRYGQRKLREAGFDALYVPHAINTRTVFTPDGRDEARASMGIGDQFVVGINAANKDAIRKGFFEQFEAFRRFRVRHPEALLLVHALTRAPQALDLQAMAQRLGILDSIRFADQYAYMTGMITPEMMAHWMKACDVGSNCAYGEGFGLANIEFPACGTPPVVTAATAMSELRGAGWAVPGERFWNSAHAAAWFRPSIPAITRAYETAWREREEGTAEARRKAAREFAIQYDSETVLREHWVPALDAIMERAGRPVRDQVPAAVRDAVTDRLAAALADGTLPAGEFAVRAAAAVKASTGAELASLIADLPVAEAA